MNHGIRPGSPSINPRSYKRGNREYDVLRDVVERPSINPRSYKRGNVRRAGVDADGDLPSINPRSYKRGNPSCRGGKW